MSLAPLTAEVTERVAAPIIRTLGDTHTSTLLSEVAIVLGHTAAAQLVQYTPLSSLSISTAQAAIALNGIACTTTECYLSLPPSVDEEEARLWSAREKLIGILLALPTAYFAGGVPATVVGTSGLFLFHHLRTSLIRS
ncbi:MAG: hypothetical protein JSS61_00530 [Verrucomicrobia bacterium]|nr:hypothetical protein [Verrucomicrobiota bacterium]